MGENDPFQSIKELYFSLDLNFSSLFQACQNDDQRNQLRRDYVNARDAFWEARNRMFVENDPLVKATTDDLRAAEQSIDHDLQSLQNIVQTLKTIDAAVSLASRLITLGAMAAA